MRQAQTIGVLGRSGRRNPRQGRAARGRPAPHHATRCAGAANQRLRSAPVPAPAPARIPPYVCVPRRPGRRRRAPPRKKYSQPAGPVLAGALSRARLHPQRLPCPPAHTYLPSRAHERARSFCSTTITPRHPSPHRRHVDHAPARPCVPRAASRRQPRPQASRRQGAPHHL